MKRAFWKKAGEFLVGILAIAGLVLAASDGPWFPQANLAGLLLVCVIAVAVSYRQEMRNLETIAESGAVGYEPAPLFFLINRISKGAGRIGRRLIRIRRAA